MAWGTGLGAVPSFATTSSAAIGRRAFFGSRGTRPTPIALLIRPAIAYVAMPAMMTGRLWDANERESEGRRRRHCVDHGRRPCLIGQNRSDAVLRAYGST